MDAGHGRGGRGGRRKKKRRQESTAPAAEPVLIAARRPGAPTAARRPRSVVAASAAPRRSVPSGVTPAPELTRAPTAAKRTATRIVQALPGVLGGEEQQRQRLLERLLLSEGRSAISRAAEEYRRAGHDYPQEQPVQLQLLEHADEAVAREAIASLGRLFERESPIKRPVLEQRLKRLEELADEPLTRRAAEALRRSLRA